MSAKVYKIVHLDDGSFALQRADGEGEPLVKVNFSEEAEYHLAGSVLEVAKVMIDAGVEAVESLSRNAPETADEKDVEQKAQRILH